MLSLGRAIPSCCVAICGVLSISAGCASAGPRGEIPLGTWSGEGLAVYERWKPDGTPDDAASRSLSFRYPTTLAIRAAVLDGHDVIELEIHSYHDDAPDLDDTHIKAALVKAKRVSDSMTLYRMVDLKLNPGSADSLTYREDGPPYAASCASANGATILQLAYRKDFLDTFRFQGPRVQKSGAYFDPKEHLVHWYEDLVRQE